MTRLTHNQALLFTVAGPAIFWVLAIFVDAEILRTIFNSLALGVFALVTFLWFRPMLWELRAHAEERNAGAWMIVLGVFYMSFTLFWQRAYSIVSLALDRPSWLLDSALAAFVPFSLMWGGFLFVMAQGMAGKASVKNSRSLVYVVIIAFIGGAAAGFVGNRALPF